MLKLSLKFSISGSTFFYPNQTRYVVVSNYPLVVPSVSAGIRNVIIGRGTIAWVPSSTMGTVPIFLFSNIVTTSTTSGTVTVSGMAGSQESILLRSVEVDVIFKDKDQISVGASRTVIDQIPANGSVPFSISYPSSPDMVPNNTLVVGYALRN